MKVAVYRTRSYGPSGVFTMPPGDEAPAHAFIPQVDPQRALSQWTGKGSDLTWEEWAERLQGHLPYFDSWTTEDVPDGITAQRALSVVRQHESDQLLSQLGEEGKLPQGPGTASLASAAP